MLVQHGLISIHNWGQERGPVGEAPNAAHTYAVCVRSGIDAAVDSGSVATAQCPQHKQNQPEHRGVFMELTMQLRLG